MLFRRLNPDVLGITTSILCAIHCTVLPLAVATLPVLGVNIIHNALFEDGMIGLAFLFGTWALRHGYFRHHRRALPWFLFTGGIILLITKQVWHAYELWILPFAVLLILSAHILNYRFCRESGPIGKHESGQ
jgi:MerC mercury resistance protein